MSVRPLHPAIGLCPVGIVPDTTGVQRRSWVRGHCGASFQQHSRRDFAGAAEALLIGEAVVSSESADGLTLAVHKRERRVRADGVAEFLELPIYAVLSEDRRELKRIKED